MEMLLKGVKRFMQEEDGVTAIEYGLLAALIAVMLIAGASAVGANLNAIFTKIAGCLATPSATCFTAP